MKATERSHPCNLRYGDLRSGSGETRGQRSAYPPASQSGECLVGSHCRFTPLWFWGGVHRADGLTEYIVKLSFSPLSRSPDPRRYSGTPLGHSLTTLSHSFNSHHHRVRRTSGFLLTALSNARPNPLFLYKLLVCARLRQSTNVTRTTIRTRQFSVVNGLDPITWFVYFFNPAVKFVTTVTDWLTCCGTRSRRIFLPSGETS
jgi:hypothetical protein